MAVIDTDAPARPVAGGARRQRSALSWAAVRRRLRRTQPGEWASHNQQWLSLAQRAARAAGEHAAGASRPHQRLAEAAGRFSSAVMTRVATDSAAIAEGHIPLVPSGKSFHKELALNYADAATEADELALAEAVLTQIIAQDPGSGAAVRGLARIRECQGLLVEARVTRASVEGADAVAEVRARVAAVEDALEGASASSRTADDVARQWQDALAGLAPMDGFAVAADATGTASDALVRARRSLTAGTLFEPTNSAGLVALASRVAQVEHPESLAPCAPAVAASVTAMDRAELSSYVRGKRVCLVANSEVVGTGGLGELIDSYDVVVRFNSFRIDEPHTGARTDIHALIHLHNFNWDVPVDVRWVMSGERGLWRRSIGEFLRPGAQAFLTDETLRWPVRSGQAIDPEWTSGIPTSGFNVMRTLDHLDTAEAIDLIGFDFYESAPYRLEQAMALPVAAAHNYGSEKDWVMAHATGVRGPVISLR